jgi:hypothetical protein
MPTSSFGFGAHGTVIGAETPGPGVFDNAAGVALDRRSRSWATMGNVIRWQGSSGQLVSQSCDYLRDTRDSIRC